MFDEPAKADKKQAISNGDLIFNDKEIEEMMNVYAQCLIEYGLEDNLIHLSYQERRKATGRKLWEDMTHSERKNEFLNVLKEDLESVSKQIVKISRAHYISNRAQDPLDPMAGFYKYVLVKLGGATITENGKIKLPLDLTERLENLDLFNKRIIELISAGGIEQFFKFKPDEHHSEIVADEAHVIELKSNADRTKALMNGGIDIGRPGLYGNPSAFGTTRDTDVKTLVEKYRDWLMGEKYHDVEPERRRQIFESILKGDLDGKGLVCYAHDGGTCHGDVLADFVKDKFLAQKALKLPDQGVSGREPDGFCQTLPMVVNFNDKEIDYMMDIYAVWGAGFVPQLNRTYGFQKEHRQLNGEKLWEQKSLIEQRQEFFEYLKKDLEFSTREISQSNKVNYMIDRALDIYEPLAGFYKVVLIKLGANIAQDGSIRLSAELKRSLENPQLQNKQIIDLAFIKKPEYQQELEPHHLNTSLRMKLTF